jgi:hypothetical protein
MADYKVVPMPKSDRFVIADKTGKVVNDAQGYGYTTIAKAEKAMWYHFGGGKKKINTVKEEARKFWSSHKDVAKDLNDLFETWFKEIARGEIEEKDLIGEICKKHSLESIPKSYLDYLP